MSSHKHAIAAFDLATTTGWALWFPETDKIQSGTLPLKDAATVGEFAYRLEKGLDDLLRGVGEVYAEAPIVARKTNLSTTMKLIGASVTLQKVAHCRGLPCSLVNVTDWRNHFIGRARAPAGVPKSQRRKWLKARAMEECEARGFSVASDDEADALGLLSYVMWERREQWVRGAPTNTS